MRLSLGGYQLACWQKFVALTATIQRSCECVPHKKTAMKAVSIRDGGD
jgi:hypothetical protein